MKISELLHDLSQPENTIASIAKGLDGISEKKLRQVLKEAGYEFRNQGQKGWYYIGEKEQPLNQSIFDFVHTSSPRVKSNSHNVKQDELSFTSEEIRLLKELVKERVVEPQEHTLEGRIEGLNKGQKVRKTIVINENVGELFDRFAEQTRFNKSDLLEVAILDLIDKYK